LKKTTYGGQHRMWLDIGHPFREAMEAFDGVAEYGETPAPVTAQQILEWAAEWENWLKDERRVQAADPVRRMGIKRRSLLYDLPYWEVIFLGRIDNKISFSLSSSLASFFQCKHVMVVLQGMLSACA
jgi:hypothetical protein